MKQLLTTADPLASEGCSTADGKVVGRCKETGKTGFVRGK